MESVRVIVENWPEKAPSLLAWAPTIIAIVAICSLFATIWMFHRGRKDAIKHQIMQNRKEALFGALEVIDHVYANSKFGGEPPVGPHAWDIQLARDSVNKMIVYCKAPKTTIELFNKAIGLHNPEVETAPEFSPKDLEEFRAQVCRELEMPELTYKDESCVWISTLPGGK